MKLLVAIVLLAGLTAPVAAGDYRLENRPQVRFSNGPVHLSPYPMSRRAAEVWASDACWRDCGARCAWTMETCIRTADADACRPQLDACDRACQRSCRNPWQGPLLGFVDF